MRVTTHYSESHTGSFKTGKITLNELFGFRESWKLVEPFKVECTRSSLNLTKISIMVKNKTITITCCIAHHVQRNLITESFKVCYELKTRSKADKPFKTHYFLVGCNLLEYFS